MNEKFKSFLAKGNRPPFLGGLPNSYKKDLKNEMKTLFETGKYEATATKGLTQQTINANYFQKQAGMWNDYLTDTEGTQFAPDAISYMLLGQIFGNPSNVLGALGATTFTGKTLVLPKDNTMWDISIVPEGEPIPVTTPNTTEVTLTPLSLKASGLFSKEYLEDVEPSAYQSIFNNLAQQFEQAYEDQILFNADTGLEATALEGNAITGTFDTLDAQNRLKVDVLQGMAGMDKRYLNKNDLLLIADSALMPYLESLNLDVQTVYSDNITAGRILWLNKRTVINGIRSDFALQTIAQPNMKQLIEAIMRGQMLQPYLAEDGKNHGAVLSTLEITAPATA